MKREGSLELGEDDGYFPDEEPTDESSNEDEDIQLFIKPDPEPGSGSSSPISYYDSENDSDDEGQMRSAMPPSSQPRGSDESPEGTPSAVVHFKTNSESLCQPFGSGNAQVKSQLSSPMTTVAEGQAETRLTPSSIIYNPSAMLRENLAGNCQPHHHESYLDLKGILKTAKSCPSKHIFDQAGLSSPSSQQAASSPTERIQHTRQDAKATRASSAKEVAKKDSCKHPILAKKPAFFRPVTRPNLVQSSPLASCKPIEAHRTKSTEVGTVAPQPSTKGTWIETSECSPTS